MYFSGLLLCGTHSFQIALINIVSSVILAGDHNGYSLPLQKSPELHDFHHLTFDNCYGLTGWLDGLHGTDSKFRRAKQLMHNYAELALKNRAAKSE